MSMNKLSEDKRTLAASDFVIKDILLNAPPDAVMIELTDGKSTWAFVRITIIRTGDLYLIECPCKREPICAASYFYSGGEIRSHEPAPQDGGPDNWAMFSDAAKARAYITRVRTAIQTTLHVEWSYWS